MHTPPRAGSDNPTPPTTMRSSEPQGSQQLPPRRHTYEEGVGVLVGSILATCRASGHISCHFFCIAPALHGLLALSLIPNLDVPASISPRLKPDTPPSGNVQVKASATDPLLETSREVLQSNSTTSIDNSTAEMVVKVLAQRKLSSVVAGTMLRFINLPAHSCQHCSLLYFHLSSCLRCCHQWLFFIPSIG